MMWDKPKPAASQRARAVGNRLDERIAAFQSATNKPARGYSYSIKGGPPPPRPPREFIESQYDSALPVQEPPPRNPNRIALRASNFRPPSSVYSQHFPPSPTRPAKLASQYDQRHGLGEISPPSSPEPDHGASHRPFARSVSPIESDRFASRHNGNASRNGNGRPGRITPQENRPPSQTQNRPPSQNANRQGSNIPMMRRARRKQSDAALRETQSKERIALNQQPQNPQQAPQDGPRWDPMTGERTTRPHGRPSQVKPAEFVHGLGVTSSPPQRTAPAPVTFGDRVRRMAKIAGPKDSDEDPAAGAFASTRPGWRGASGRTAIVDPVKDDPEVAPLQVPERSTRRVVSPTSATAPKSSFMGNFLRRGQTPPVSPGYETGAEAAPQDTIRKVVPSSQLSPNEPSQNPQDRQNAHSSPAPPNMPSAPERAAKELTRDVLSSISANSPNSPSYPGGASPQGKSAVIKRKPAANAGHHQQESVSSVYSQHSEMPPQPPAHNPNANTLPPNDPWVQPQSRFSVTTYATSAADGTPRESIDDFPHNHPPVPSMPSAFKESPKPKQESVMDRRRPKLDTSYDDGARSTHASPVVISLKDEFVSSPFRYGNESQAARDRRAAATGAHANPAVNRTRAATSERPTSSSSINKMLPPVPPETSAGEARDRVGLLNAQLQALANRRININRSIKQMTELMPTDNVLDSMDVVRKREAEKRKVEVLKQELAEVQREEYELGLKLHRAYKRLDRDADWEPTTLWVRRVTG
ncbi:hypothetical protein B0T16DRAFT_420275 [Cercophora newfieldiana]|uniref:Uncharacterized protein n=1 Tax=Cercophora newfieldiana TaxID=92897 RepID=A0AA39XX00_9PEZI|nr:hypothetical protein B0T16DRAFT_420275 [Cercophora newfieldiana]